MRSDVAARCVSQGARKAGNALSSAAQIKVNTTVAVVAWLAAVDATGLETYTATEEFESLVGDVAARAGGRHDA